MWKKLDFQKWNQVKKECCIFGDLYLILEKGNPTEKTNVNSNVKENTKILQRTAINKAKSEKITNKITNKSAEFCPMNKNTDNLNSANNINLYIKNNYDNKGATNKLSSFY